MALRIKSLAVAAPSIEQLCTKFAARLKEAKPDALLWLTDSQQTAAVAKVASRACASIGARTDAGLIGGGSEFYGPPGAEARVAALITHQQQQQQQQQQGGGGAPHGGQGLGIFRA